MQSVQDKVSILLEKSPEFRGLSYNDRYRTVHSLEQTRSSTQVNLSDWAGLSRLFNLQQDNAANIDVNSINAFGITAFHSCVRLRAQGLAVMELKLYDKKTKKEVVNHPALKLLKRPSSYQTGYDFSRNINSHCVGRGNGYAYIVRDFNGKPIRLVPILNPDSVLPMLVEGRLIYVVSNQGYPYMEQVPNEIESYNMFHLKGMTWDNPLVGVSPIYAHRESLASDISAGRYAGTTFKSGAKKFAIETSKNIDAEGQIAMKQSFEDILEDRSVSTVLPEGAKISSLSLSPIDMDYINYSNLKVADIGRIFGVNNSMLNIDGTSNLTGEQVYQSFYADTLLPDATNYEQECWEKLLSESEKENLYFKHTFSSLIRASSNDRADYITKMINSGGMSPNEAALLNDFEEVEGGDERQIQTNLIPLSMQAKWIDGKIARDTAGAKNNNNPNGNNQDNGGQ